MFLFLVGFSFSALTLFLNSSSSEFYCCRLTHCSVIQGTITLQWRLRNLIEELRVLFNWLILLFGECCRIRRRFQRIEIEGSPGRKRSLSTRFWPQPPFTWGTCRFTRRRSKFTSSSRVLGKSKRSSWAWTRTQKRLAASVSFCESQLLWKH